MTASARHVLSKREMVLPHKRTLLSSNKTKKDLVSLGELVPMAERLHIHTLEDWYKVPKAHLKQVGGANLLKSYPITCIVTVGFCDYTKL
jgi:hypothetical protein